MAESNTIQLEKRFNQCTATGRIKSNNILVDKWFSQIVCSSKLENNTKKNLIKYSQTIQTHDGQSKGTFAYSTRMTPTKRSICFRHRK